ncbi:hypothetical protein HHL17_28575 [Chitinophaga sp. G-6-1-13]|uniref:Disease resistance R13L4/SHOC-2-like LRR domain-containing protein n=1 Tax=Chitinophaga fulva TaxID=2728842 RepID=A0A848GX14_9BACT|nr:hypothetical protein [Chitinophaga fulva]NML41183.1 hypothetical protein [Chitinophaga fulva]
MDYFETHIMKDAQETGYVNLQGKRLVTLPPGYEAAARLPYVHFDVSDNQRLQHETVIGQLASIPHIQALDMAETNMKELPAGIIRLSELQYLNLSENGLTELPGFIAELQQLKVLRINDNELVRLQALKRPLPCLEELHLFGNALTELAAFDLSVFPALKILHLSEGKFSHLPESITRLAHLETLSINNNKKLEIDDTCLLLAGCKSLRRLSLARSGHFFHTESLELLQQLTAIDLKGTGAQSLPDMPNLTEIDCDWQLPAPFYFNMIKDRDMVNSLHLSDIQPYEEDGVRTLPANIGELKYLRRLTCTDLQRLPASLGNLGQLKLLEFINGQYTSLPDLSGLQGLEEVSISGTGFTTFPEFIYQLPALKTLTIERCNVSPDYARVVRLPALEKVSADNMTDADLQHFMRPVEGRYIEVLLPTSRLPEAFYDLPCVREFDFNQHKNIDVNLVLSKLHRLPNLHTLIFNKVRPLPLATCISWLQQLPQLKKVTLYLTEQQVPPSLADLTHLTHIYLCWNEAGWGIPDLPPVLATMRPGQLVLEKKPFTEAYMHAFEVLHTHRITGTAARELAFCLLARRYDTLKKMLPWPFTPDGKLPGAQVYIAGDTTMCTRKELKEILQQRGATVAGEIAAATHIFVGRNISATAIIQLSERLLPVVLEDHLKEQTIKEDRPFFMEAGGDELVSQVTRLIKTENNLMLALHIIRGGGANPVLLGYLAAIYLFHHDKNIVTEAKVLFRKFASAALQHHIDVTWKPEYRYKREDEFAPVYLHPELDMFAFLLAYMRCRSFNETVTGNLWLKNIPDDAVTDSIRDLYPLNMVSIESPGNDAITRLLEKLPLVKFQSLVIEAPLETLPQAVWGIPTLYSIRLVLKGSPGFTIPPLEPGRMAFSRLQMELGHLVNPERLAACTQLKECVIIDCNLSTADFVTGMPGLETLNIANNNMAALPAGLRQCTELSSLFIMGNSITEKDVDTLKLPKLNTLNNSPYTKTY